MTVAEKIKREIAKQGCYLCGFGEYNDTVAIHALKEALKQGKVKMTPQIKKIVSEKGG